MDLLDEEARDEPDLPRALDDDPFELAPLVRDLLALPPRPREELLP